MTRSVGTRLAARMRRHASSARGEAAEGHAWPVFLYAATIFLAASLLFVVQPMVARLLLPMLGGSPSVWNTCMVFFQGMLLLSYAYVHASTSRLPSPARFPIHALLLLAPASVLPISFHAASRLPAPAANPVAWLLLTLLLGVGLPFFVVATTAPLLQSWYGKTVGRHAHDPYFLYAASNAGSLLALLGYPTLLEPWTSLGTQCRLWSAGYVALAVLVVLCGTMVPRGAATTAELSHPWPSAQTLAAVKWSRWARWVALAFVPSSLMLGVTTFLTTDIAAVPLLWVVPLGIYLASFIVVFSRHGRVAHEVAARLLPPAALLVAWTSAVGGEPRPSLLVMHLAAFCVVCLVSHGALALDRPGPEALTSYYLAMSLGGVLGGLFNALVAPLVFTRVVEYPLVLGLACLALTASNSETSAPRSRGRRGVLTVLLLLVLLGRWQAWSVPALVVATKLGALAVAGLAWAEGRHRPAWLALTVLALGLAGLLPAAGSGRVLWSERNFFGVSTVSETTQGDAHLLVHGRTLHGRQSLDPARRGEPSTYYHRTGPMGDVFRVLGAGADARGTPARVGIVGLGAGSTAAYARPGERWVFHEIDPAVVRVAGDPRYFTYLSDCKAGPPAIVLGDARLRLREAEPGAFDLLVLDAFSSDAIPVHLLTREALALYRRAVSRDGLIAVHISNRYVDLRPVVADLARDAGWTCRVRRDLELTAEQASEGKSGSIWAVLAPVDACLGAIGSDARWERPRLEPASRVWTDDHSDLVARLVGLR